MRERDPAAPVSVVIATLGGDTLKATLERLNAGTVVPAEILISIPAEEAHKVSDYTFPNVRVLATPFRGQVAQRAAGFGEVANVLVLQLDDDIVVERDCVEILIRELHEHGPRCAVAPALRWTGSGRSVYKQPPRRTLAAFFYWCLNGAAGYRAGAVTRAGMEIGVYSAGGQDGCVEADWLPGGCVLHRRENLVTENFFPMAGKAFCEDLIHSHLLRERSIRLFVSHGACAYITETPHTRVSTAVFLRGICAELQARRYYVELSSRSALRMYLYFAAKILRRVVRYEI